MNNEVFHHNITHLIHSLLPDTEGISLTVLQKDMRLTVLHRPVCDTISPEGNKSVCVLTFTFKLGWKDGRFGKIFYLKVH